MRHHTNPEVQARTAAAARAIDPAREVTPVELEEAVLALIVQRFGNRQLTWETVEMALSHVNFRVKQLAMFAA